MFFTSSMKALGALLAMLATSPALAESVQLSGGRVLETGLAEARLISELNGYAIIAGRSCIDCDENTAIYIRRIARPRNGAAAEKAGAGTSERYTYPGRYRDYLSKELVEKTRMFYGRCYENQPSLLWLSEYREDGDWTRSEYLILIGENGLEHRYNENRQPSTVYIDNTGCEELAGITAETEP